METLRLSRTAYQLIERGFETLEQIGRELEQYNDRQECDDEKTVGDGADEPDRNET